MSLPALEDIPDDEWEFDFGDNKPFLEVRWEATLVQCQRALTPADWQRAVSVTTAGRLVRYLQIILQSRLSDVILHSKIGDVVQSIQVFKQLADEVEASMSPRRLDLAIIWGLIALLVESTIEQPARLDNLVTTLGRFRVLTLRTVRCVRTYRDEAKESRLAMVVSTGEIALALAEIMRFMRENPSGTQVVWPQTQQDRVDKALARMENGVKDLYNVATTSQNLEQVQAGFATLERTRAAATARMDDSDIFPCVWLPSRRNDKFYGREEQLREIDNYLDPRAKRLRTYMIYGRRGVGKTNIALEYAYRNPSKFDAIFWINCETASALRTSFTRMALKLKLGGVEPTGHHEENLIICHKWLARTEKTWLLIFDNAENDELLRLYWPESTGAIIITSRRWTNFNNNALRDGQTIHPFAPAQGWELFVRLANWGERLEKSEISDAEITAAQELVTEFEGLPLAIDQAASLVKAARFSSVPELLDAYRHASTNAVPFRPTHLHSKTHHAVDSIWYVSFQNLSRNAKAILSVLCLLSPDVTYLDVFLPRSQTAITEFLAFCRQPTQTSSTLTTEARTAVRELIDASLIKQEGRILSVHRVVQEAFFYVNKIERQGAFYAAVHLVYDAFPKQVNGRPLHSQWERCERFVQDGIYVADRYTEFERIGDPLKAPRELLLLVMNVAWYLYEIGDYRESLRIAAIGYGLCDDLESMDYAHLRNTAGSCYHELMELENARTAWEDALEIRQLSTEIEELANTTSNYGNLAFSEGLYLLSLERHEQAKAMRVQLETAGEPVQIPLAVSHMCMARAQTALKRYEEATASLDEAESLILQVAPANTPFMANLYYARGNMALSEGNDRLAREHYQQSRSILNTNTPTHLLVSSVHFKLACVEFNTGEVRRSIRHLDVAYELADLRRQGPNDGNIARVLWKKSQILTNQVVGFTAKQDTEQAARLRTQAEQMFIELQQAFPSEHRDDTTNPDERAFDKLICGFFR